MLENSRKVQEGIKALEAASRARLHGELAGTALDRFVDTWTAQEHWDAVDRALAKS